MKFFKRWVALLITAAMLPMGVSASPTENTVDTVSVPGWIVISAYSDSKAYIDDENAYSGKASLKMANNTTQLNAQQFLKVQQNLNVKKGKTYRYGFKAKAKNGEKCFSMINYDNRYSLTPISNTYDWTSFDFEYTHLSDTAVVEFSITADSVTEGLWIDEVYFTDPDTGENLISNDGFEIGDPVVASSNETDIPVFKRNITVDGRLDDWADIQAQEITHYQTFTPDAKTDIKGNIRYAYDDEYFYTVIETQDAVHYPIAGNNYWMGDGIQFAISSMSQGFGTEMGMAYHADTGKTEFFGNDNMLAKATKTENGIIYEFGIPWGAEFENRVPPQFKFDAIINNNDGDGRKYCLEIAPGISMYKSNAEFPIMFPANESEKFDFWVKGTQTPTSGTAESYAVSIYNKTDKTIKVNLKSEMFSVNKTVQAAPHSIETLEFNAAFENYGEETIPLTLTSEKSIASYNYSVNVKMSEKNYAGFIEKVKNMRADLKKLLYKCSKKHIAADYEMVNFSVINQFVGYIEEEHMLGDLSRMIEYDNALTSLYNEAKENLILYLDGKKTPPEVPKYVTSDMSVNGTSVLADTETNGKVERKPMFFVGYGHWQQVRDDVTKFQTLGANIIQAEIGPNSVIFPERIAAEWDIATAGGSQIQFEASQDNAVLGKYSLKIHSGEPYIYNRYSYIRQSINVKPDTTYEFGLKAKAENVSTTWFSVKGLSVEDGTRKSLNGTYDWKDFSYRYTTGPMETTLEFVILSEDIADSLYIDNIYVKKAGSSVNLIANGDFEDGKGEVTEGGYSIGYKEIESLERTLAEAEKSNVSVNLSIAPQYFPGFISNEDQTISEGGKFNQFVPFNPGHPKVREVMEIFIKTLIPRVAKYKSLHDICLVNEPWFNSAISEYYVPMWQAYIKEKYGTINELNKVYGSSYSDFAQVIMPKSDTMPQGDNNTPLYYDWCSFNDKILADFHAFLAKEVKKYAPNLLTHTKIMQYFHSFGNSRLNIGTNYELWAENMDLNGNDASAYLNTPTAELPSKMGWYDLLTSIKDAPVWNTEDHILIDNGIIDYQQNQTLHAVTDIWQGAIHGRGGSMIWIWDRLPQFLPTGNENFFSNTNMTLRPATMAEVGRASLDLNRLAEEVTAIQKNKRRVGLVYSRTALVYNDTYMSKTNKAYENIIYNGQKVGMITDTNSDDLNQYDIIIAVDANNVPSVLRKNIIKYAENGGKLLLLGEKPLEADNYNKPYDAAETAKLRALAKTGKSDDTLMAASIREIINESGIEEVILTDADTGERLDKVEWSHGFYGDKVIVNVCNYEWDKAKRIKITYDNKTAEHIKELRSGKEYDSIITIEPYKPILLELSK
ncbi:MAG: beta-galactosidase [Clostridia bacterium]|nr:beta-galactosidase [Clostridia bacterium]